MVAETGLYDLLYIAPSATTDEISRAYRKLALRCHPDKTNHDELLTEHFKELTRAYEVLKDAKKRLVYDHYGEAGLDGTAADATANQQPQRPAGRNCAFNRATNLFTQMFSDINLMFALDPVGTSMGFQNPFGGPMAQGPSHGMKKAVQPGPAKAPARLVRGLDIHHTFKVTLADLYFGKVVKFLLPKNSRCKVCCGSGLLRPTLCSTCNGLGLVIVTLYNDYSQFQEMSSCHVCNGTGVYSRPADVCSACVGGFVKEKKIIKVNILPGSKNGDKCILQGGADEGRNIIPGDVVIHLEELLHPYLIRRFNDLYMEHDIDLKTALLGGTVWLHDFVKKGQDLRIFVNAHGNASLNAGLDSSVAHGDVVGTINSGVPKIVKGFGMPINESIIDGIYYQDPSDPLEFSDVVFDMKRYKKGNLFVKFNVQLPSLDDFRNGAADLLHLQQILPDKNDGYGSQDALDCHLSNLNQCDKAAPILGPAGLSSPTKSIKTDLFQSSTDSVDTAVDDSDGLKGFDIPAAPSTEYDYNDIDFDDHVDGDDQEEQSFYNKQWSNNKRRKPNSKTKGDPPGGLNQGIQC